MITLGVPSKGRLMEKTFQWFADRGIEMRRTGSDRDYGAEIADLPVALRLLAAGEIPRELAAGRIHLGVTGSDLVQERIPAWDQAVDVVAEMGFGHADLIIAVPAWWVDVTSLDDLDAVSADFRATHGHRLRIATKYHRLVRDFLREKGVADYRLVDSQGATEGTVAHGTAEAIADITSTGETLRANHLAILRDGLIHRSEATLFRSRIAPWGDAERAGFAAITARLEAHGAA
ncbi:ATP phosphoribosyltransferase [Gymnodinialimonas sp.]